MRALMDGIGRKISIVFAYGTEHIRMHFFPFCIISHFLYVQLLSLSLCCKWVTKALVKCISVQLTHAHSKEIQKELRKLEMAKISVPALLK